MSASQLSFDRAQFPGDPPPADVCAFCKRNLEREYFRVANHLACATCAANAQALVPPDSHSAFSRALLFGLLASAVGCIGYALFGILTGITLGWIAVGVGYLVGWAMKKGSCGLGGRRYQITAAILTYAAVAVAFVPQAIHDQNVEKRATAATQTAATQTDTERSSAAASEKANAAAANATGSTPAQARISFGTFAVSLLMLLGIGLISPFLLLTASVGHGLINLFILFLGMRAAWQLMAGTRLDVQGPFSTAGPA